MQVSLDEFHNVVSDLCRLDLPPCDQRYEYFSTVDPYPKIAPALLHAEHVASYAIATGMIDPFDPLKLTKPATYLVPLMGVCQYLDGDGKRVKFYLTNDPGGYQSGLETRGEFDLMPNSIFYVTLKPRFRMPSYIAGRFNLLIRDVYRGLLVGTGPLVDPGFDGYLSIPIHNFTSRSYTLHADEDFVYFEFTKLSWLNPSGSQQQPTWCPCAIEIQPPFPSDKRKRRTLDD